MAQSIPTARIPPPGICRAFVGHLSFFVKKKLLKKPHGGDSGRGQMPDPWDKIKILFTDLSKKHILAVFSGFSRGFLKHYFVFNYNCNALQNLFQNLGF